MVCPGCREPARRVANATVSLTEAQAIKRGWKGFTEYRNNSEPDTGWDYNPADSQDEKLNQIIKDRQASCNVGPHTFGRKDMGGGIFNANCSPTAVQMLNNLSKGFQPKAVDNAGMEQKIIEYAQAAKNDDGKTRWLKIGAVGAIDKIKAVTGVDLTGYSHILDASKIKHAMIRHGNDATERKNNQRGITAADFAKVALIVDAHDKVSLSTKTSNGNLKALIFVKPIGNEEFYYVTEVRAGRKQLAPATLYVKI